jgi:hypothetical protein
VATKLPKGLSNSGGATTLAGRRGRQHGMPRRQHHKQHSHVQQIFSSTMWRHSQYMQLLPGSPQLCHLVAAVTAAALVIRCTTCHLPCTPGLQCASHAISSSCTCSTNRYTIVVATRAVERSQPAVTGSVGVCTMSRCTRAALFHILQALPCTVALPGCNCHLSRLQDFSESYRCSLLPAYSPDGRFIAAAVEYRLVIREVESLKVVQIYSCLDKIHRIEWSASGK